MKPESVGDKIENNQKPVSHTFIARHYNGSLLITIIYLPLGDLMVLYLNKASLYWITKVFQKKFFSEPFHRVSLPEVNKNNGWKDEKNDIKHCIH